MTQIKTNATNCTICKAPATTLCPRCDCGLCMIHSNEPGRLCVDCELELGRLIHTRGQKILGGAAFVVLFVLGLLGLDAMKEAGYLEGRGSGTGWDGAVMIFVMLIVVAAATAAVVGVRGWLMRAHFTLRAVKRGAGEG
jgi:hypothetical protein